MRIVAEIGNRWNCQIGMIELESSFSIVIIIIKVDSQEEENELIVNSQIIINKAFINLRRRTFLYLSMECPNCQQSYESALSKADQSAVPRILSKCGHSVCHSCVLKLYNNKRIVCPICASVNIADSVQMFTKNLALM